MWGADSRIYRRKNPPFHLTGWFTVLPIPACPLHHSQIPFPNSFESAQYGRVSSTTPQAFPSELSGASLQAHTTCASQRTLNPRTFNPRIRSTPHHTVSTVISPDWAPHAQPFLGWEAGQHKASIFQGLSSEEVKYTHSKYCCRLLSTPCWPCRPPGTLNNLIWSS